MNRQSPQEGCNPRAIPMWLGAASAGFGALVIFIISFEAASITAAVSL